MNIVFVYYWKLVYDGDLLDRELRKGINKGTFFVFFYAMLELLIDYCALRRFRIVLEQF